MNRFLKIFQLPSDRVIRAGFFTTKLTGQGIGLGLSVSYDVIKAHEGVPIAIGIKVESTEGEGSEFLIQIPIKKL